MTRHRTCELCGAALTAGPHGGRPARYCSSACRQRAFRQRSMHKGSGRERPTAPDASPPGSGRGLPQALDSFVGRRQELSVLRTLLRTSRLLTLTGAGGVGKTRLALEFAKGLPERYARVDLIELESLHDDAPLAQSVASALGVGERAGRPGTDALVRAIGNTSRLLILDNCEHLAEPCARLAATLLSHCPRLRILATSREALRVPGETVFRVGELSLPPTSTGGDPDALLRSDAVRLFVERAAGCVPGFTLGRGNGATVAEICRQLDGLTLGIELAARRVGTLPLDDILAGLNDRLFQLSLLTDGSRTGPRRHTGLTAAIAWSHRLLEPTEQAVFRRLAVLVGGFDAGAAEAVCAGGTVAPRQVLGILCALEAKSLIVRLPDNAHPARFRQLSAVRACAMEHLIASGELDAVRRQSLDWLNSLTERADGEVFADQAVGPLTGERDNLAAALADTGGGGGASRDRLALELARVYYQHEQPSAARSLLDKLLRLPAGPALDGAVAALATRVACQQTDLAGALRLGEQAVRQESTRDHPAGLANALDARAAARLCRGEFAAAVADLRDCLRIVCALGRREDTAWCTHHLAWALLQAGAEAEADLLMARCLPVLREQAHWSRAAAALHTAGAVRLSLGRLDNAEELFGEVLRIVPEASFHALYPVEGLALVAAERGDLRRALRLYEASAHARRRLDTEPEDPWRQRVELTAARARAGLSAAAQDAAVSGGRRLRGDRLVAYALRRGSGNPRSASYATAVVVDQFPLTGREFMVAELVAEGLTNRQIAEQLGLSAHTVATHLDKIRDKLGLRSRTRIAVWAATRSKDDG
ncbi:ATP-binding protein [Streptomyces rhizosphaerihabitans]|uniref:ATP-binding protein n=1 Tax=Streptomyces rhizosphaerihabitans TaxID=1266770 RepID=UPI0021C1193D|nr:LuxR C-terminal-related transcriptional regulator [Streptomyces rhizosphaerihabitans]MCT9010905.1 LuxR C-terminal-related transcriptional regulator [Streptomyces rhizosphaerihabitans]